MSDSLTEAIRAEITADPFKAGAETIATKTRAMIDRIRNSSNLDASDALLHHVRLVLDNDAQMYNDRREIVLSGLREDAYPHEIGDNLKDYVEELTGVEHSDALDLSPMNRELIFTALAFVDWRALAEGYIEEERERVDSRVTINL